jgi:hypothetical protein
MQIVHSWLLYLRASVADVRLFESSLLYVLSLVAVVVMLLACLLCVIACHLGCQGRRLVVKSQSW